MIEFEATERGAALAAGSIAFRLRAPSLSTAMTRAAVGIGEEGPARAFNLEDFAADFISLV